MTLPFSDKPEKSSIYQDVKTETLQELTSDQFDTFRARMFAEGVNGLEDEYRRLVLLGLASDKLSVSGPIPNTGQIVSYVLSTSGGTPSLAFQPGPGEVYSLTGVSTTASGNSGTITYELYISDDDPFDVNTACQLIGIQATSSRIPLNETPLSTNILIDENMPIYVEATGTFSTITWNIGLIRLR